MTHTPTTLSAAESKALSDLLAYVRFSEFRNWQESGRPNCYAYRAVLTLSKALKRKDRTINPFICLSFIDQVALEHCERLEVRPLRADVDAADIAITRPCGEQTANCYGVFACKGDIADRIGEFETYDLARCYAIEVSCAYEIECPEPDNH